MSSDKRVAMQALPDVITIYRGCYDHNRQGLSWTLDRDIAMRFAGQLNRYSHQGKTPMILSARIRKIGTFLKLDRDEQEVVVSRRVRPFLVQEVTS